MTGKSKKRSEGKATSSSSSSMASSPPPPPQPQSAAAAKKGFLRRILPFLLTANLAVGAYILARTWKKESPEKDEEPTEKAAPSPLVSTSSAASEKAVHTESLPAPVKAQPIPEHEQRELLKWILEEKRKVKPKDVSEKRRIDEEKALLKQLIRSESIPSL